MISKSKVRLIKSLQVKKYRLAEQCFLVQGAKAVSETLASDYKVELLCATASFLSQAHHSRKASEVIETSEKELTSMGSVESNNAAIAVVRMKKAGSLRIPTDQFTLALDGLSDPGNMGTIIRTADWYGISQVLSSKETTDFYSPKVINATMGSFLRVQVFYGSLVEMLADAKVPVYGAFLDGDDVHRMSFEKGGIIIIGSESHGISEPVAQLVTKRITIPRHGRAESLNASVAAAILLDNVRRTL